ncbi:hypothetical protein CEUSTIGMA_g326.t1 [Chlamydomonas eustigma]|uniref:Uncharacterized protein n=1 Tax=Chlamydomonas eustigma TaxID=1157962 RepID=A0A250WPZ7_9CHLO|nr:hypothetical protein CEUSTIGMA_g326.t1 [Chlamydomonas eustigma]|eukprot:GAX72871.1 hypothetical protein CEUSTIGMA_g326.t1 [Chlamydomonas eustigma]
MIICIRHVVPRSPYMSTIRKNPTPVSSSQGIGCHQSIFRASKKDEEDGFDVDFETLFAKELKRRGLKDPAADNVSEKVKPASISQLDPVEAKKDPFQTKTRFRSPPPQAAAAPTELDGQRERTMGFVNEGLEGLIPRGTQLLQLGGSIFLGFLPFMLAFSVLFTCIYAVFGDSFLHGGRIGSGPPPYIDPEVLLSAPTVDPYVPLR